MFTWTNPAPQDGDAYLWRTVQSGTKGTYTSINEPQ